MQDISFQLSLEEARRFSQQRPSIYRFHGAKGRQLPDEAAIAEPAADAGAQEPGPGRNAQAGTSGIRGARL